MNKIFDGISSKIANPEVTQLPHVVSDCPQQLQVYKQMMTEIAKERGSYDMTNRLEQHTSPRSVRLSSNPSKTTLKASKCDSFPAIMLKLGHELGERVKPRNFNLNYEFYTSGQYGVHLQLTWISP